MVSIGWLVQEDWSKLTRLLFKNVAVKLSRSNDVQTQSEQARICSTLYERRPSAEDSSAPT